LPVVEPSSKSIQPPIKLDCIFQGKENSLRQYRVPSDAKKTILAQLYRLGIHEHSLFPDLDHLALVLTQFYHDKLYLTDDQKKQHDIALRKIKERKNRKTIWPDKGN
jgi:hypothetical protein